MHAQICQFPSHTLYASKLKSHHSVSLHLLSDLPNTRSFIETQDEDTIREVLGSPVVFFDTAGCEYYERLEGDGDEGSRCNENEALVVKGWTEKLVRLTAEMRLLLLISGGRFKRGYTLARLPSSPRSCSARALCCRWLTWVYRYQAQVTLLSSLLRPEYGPELEIGTVDGMQGREKDAVIISLVRSNDKVSIYNAQHIHRLF